MEVINMKRLRYPNIAAERARMGLTLEEFSEILGVTRKTILNWETKGNIPQGALEKMADLFNVTVEYLLAA
jgi:transcriptional regulator with XRE-family HTH domain